MKAFMSVEFMTVAPGVGHEQDDAGPLPRAPKLSKK